MFEDQSINQTQWAVSHAKVTRQRLDKNILPWLGDRQLDTIPPPDILEILRRVEARGAYETARRCLSICSQIFDFAQATGRCSRDPCHGLNKALAPVRNQHMDPFTQSLHHQRSFSRYICQATR